MKISKGNIQNINRKILAGTLAFTFLGTKFIGYSVVKRIKYSHVKSEYVSTDEYAILPEKVELNFNDSICEPNNPKNNYRKNKGMVAKKKGKTLQKVL